MAGAFFLAMGRGKRLGNGGPYLIRSPKRPRENLVKVEAKAGRKKGNFQSLAMLFIPQVRETEENLI